MPQNPKNIRYTPTMEVETSFRQAVRNALDLDPFVRDYQIIEGIQQLKEEVQRLKRLEKCSR